MDGMDKARDSCGMPINWIVVISSISSASVQGCQAHGPLLDQPTKMFPGICGARKEPIEVLVFRLLNRSLLLTTHVQILFQRSI